MHRDSKAPEPINGASSAKRSSTASSRSGNDDKTPVNFITLPMGMRVSDGPPPRATPKTPPPESDDEKKSTPDISQERSSKPRGSSNPFASFMPMSDSEAAAARLSLSEDEISSAIDTFSPLDEMQGATPRKRKSSIGTPPPVPGSTRSKGRTTQEVVADENADPSSISLEEISIEDLAVSETPTLRKKAPEVENRQHLPINLAIIALVILVSAAIGMILLLNSSPDPVVTEAQKTADDGSQRQGLKPKPPKAPSQEHGASSALSDPSEKSTQKAAATGDDAKTSEAPAAGEMKQAGAEEVSEPVEKPKSAGPAASSTTTAPDAVPSSSPMTVEPPPSEPPPTASEKEAEEDEEDLGSEGDAQVTPAPSAGAMLAASGQDTVIIKLTGLPKDAAISVDGVAMDSPFEIPRSDRTIKVVVNAPDYETAVKRIIPGQDKAVLVRMKKKK